MRSQCLLGGHGEGWVTPIPVYATILMSVGLDDQTPKTHSRASGHINIRLTSAYGARIYHTRTACGPRGPQAFNIDSLENQIYVCAWGAHIPHAHRPWPVGPRAFTFRLT